MTLFEVERDDPHVTACDQPDVSVLCPRGGIPFGIARSHRLDSHVRSWES